MQIENFSLNDYDSVYDLWKELPGVGLSDADSQENIQFYLAQNPNMSFTVKEQGKIIGAVLCGHDGRRGFIHHLSVNPAFRRRGVAKKLVARCLASLKKEGINKCHVFVKKSNLQGAKFWDAMGWSERTDLAVYSQELV